MRLRASAQRLRRLCHDQSGFSLPEMLVTIMIMIVVLSALYGIFDMSIRVFSFGNDKVESTENARVALGRMEREIRAAYPYNPPTNIQRFSPSASDANQITFYNDVSNNTLFLYNDDGKGNGDKETIRYFVSGGNLMRQEGTATAQSLAPLGPGGSLEFAYLDKTTGAPIALPLDATKEQATGMIRIRLVVVQESSGNDPRQELITNAALRNRST